MYIGFMEYSSANAHEMLHSHFKFKDFRSGQEEIIKCITEGYDTLVVMPTGGGKSLCYQIPSMLRQGLAIIVSPLIALMQDQIEALHKAKVPATYINSTLTSSEIRQRMQNAQFGAYKMLYIAPERLESASFLEQLQTLPISMLVIDEAHCISEWGHDFRPSYMAIPRCFESIARVPIIALTATATPEVQFDIQKNLKMESPKCFIRGFDRPNLTYKTEETNKKAERIVDILEETANGTTIIYCGSRKRVENFTEQLREYKVSALTYHGGMDDKHRAYSQTEFVSGSCKVLVATNAFGMGIDKADVRNVIHCDLTQTLESYYQEAGRAGRDGKPSNCTLLYHSTDRRLMDFFIDSTYPDRNKIETVYNTLYDIQATPLGGKPLAPILMDSFQLAQRSGIPSNAVQTILNLLQRYDIVREGADSGMATVQFTTSNERIKEYLNNIAQDKQKVLVALLRSVGAGALSAAIQFDVREMLMKHDLSLQSMESAMKTFEYARILRYQPPGATGGITLLLERMPFSRLPIDFNGFYERRERAVRKLDIVERYATSSECKRNFILHYFQDNAIKEKCGKCTSCLSYKQSIKKLNRDGEFLRQAILTVCSETSGRFGKKIIHDILSGNKSPKVETLLLHKMKSFGVASDFDNDEVSVAILQSLEDGLIETTKDQYPTLNITALGFKYVQTMYPPFVYQKISRKVDVQLFEILKNIRTEISNIENTSPEIIISDMNLEAIAEKLAVSRDDLITIGGLNDIFLTRFASHFIAAVKKYLSADSENTDIEYESFPPTVRESVRLAREGFSIWQIAEKRDIEITSIAKHLETAITGGLHLERNRLIGNDLYFKVSNYLSHNRRALLRELREHCGAQYDMAELRLAAAFARMELNIKITKR